VGRQGAIPAVPTPPAPNPPPISQYGLPLLLDPSADPGGNRPVATITTPQARHLFARRKLRTLYASDNRVEAFVNDSRPKADLPDCATRGRPCLAGKPSHRPQTKSIGCSIPLTTIASIALNKCVPCLRPGGYVFCTRRLFTSTPKRSTNSCHGGLALPWVSWSLGLSRGVPVMAHVLPPFSVGGALEATNAGTPAFPIFDRSRNASNRRRGAPSNRASATSRRHREADIRSQIGFGDGIYKSNGRRKTWQPFLDEGHAGRSPDSRDPRESGTWSTSRARGHVYAPNPERVSIFLRGLAAAAWTNVLDKRSRYRAVDLRSSPPDSAPI